MAQDVGDRFAVLFVCTANICRSAMAEQLFRSALPSGAGIDVHSFGTHALVGHDLDGPTSAALAELGHAVARHAARQLDHTAVATADLVLTATTRHRSEVLDLVPSAAGRTFTLREFARLGRDLPDVAPPLGDRAMRTALITRVADVAARRDSAPPAAPGADEVGDPFAAPYDAVLRCAITVRDAVAETVRILGVSSGPR